MTWVKLDDGFFRHPKIIGLSKDARLLFLAGLCHCASNLTDGKITAGALRIVAAEAEVRPTIAKKLVEAGMWEQADDGSYEVHDYLEYNPSRADVESHRAAGRRRVEAHRKRTQRDARSNGVTGDASNGVTGDATNDRRSRDPSSARPRDSSSSSDSRPPQPPAGGKPPETTTNDETPPLPAVGEGLTVDQLWPEMARRKLALERTAGRGPTRRGQGGWLGTTAASYEADHHQRAVDELAETYDGTPADYLISLLEPALADRDYTGFTPHPWEPTDPPDTPASDPDAARDALAAARTRRHSTGPGDLT